MNQYPVYKHLDLAKTAKDVLSYWKDKGTFAQSIQQRSHKPTFTFYEGPPSANGEPGIHHVLARTLKDIFARYKTMQGYQVQRRAGWDAHGLPVELQVERTLGISKADIGNKISMSPPPPVPIATAWGGNPYRSWRAEFVSRSTL